MPQIDLSKLDGAELRSLLDSARRQGQAAQSYEILREMEARRHRPPRPKTLAPKRPRPEPHTISLELGDPLERKEDPLFDQGADDLPPLTLAEAPRRKAARPPKPPPAPKPRGWAHWGALLFALGLAGGVYGGWWAANFANAGAPRAAGPPPAPATAAVQVAELPPAPPADSAEASVSLVPEAAQTVPAPPPPLAAADGAAPTTTTPAAAPAEPEATASTPAPAAIAAATSPSEAAPAARPVQSVSADAACTGATTPADRTICADPKLRSLQGELRKAYAEALDAHQDRALLRQRELAWRDARNAVTDPHQLAALYRQRIEKLRAATADALARRPTGL
jgi:uncharacterized protein YecT (DUF1311 family)